jgi:branched-chain amino acid transport system permease protein
LGFDALALQLLNGLSHATTLFLMASGLTLIFGVTRIVNFAHGSFFMLGALWSAHAVTHGWPAMAESAWGYGAVILMGACLAALLGAATEVLLLKRMRHAPQLYQLVATFGLTPASRERSRWASRISPPGNCSPWHWALWSGWACIFCSRARCGGSGSKPPRKTATCSMPWA